MKVTTTLIPLVAALTLGACKEKEAEAPAAPEATEAVEKVTEGADAAADKAAADKAAADKAAADKGAEDGDEVVELEDVADADKAAADAPAAPDATEDAAKPAAEAIKKETGDGE